MDRFLQLESRSVFYAKLRSATAEAGRAGKLETRVVAEDMALLDKKLLETSSKMQMLAPCLKA
jgi:hypothetical protein